MMAMMMEWEGVKALTPTLVLREVLQLGQVLASGLHLHLLLFASTFLTYLEQNQHVVVTSQNNLSNLELHQTLSNVLVLNSFSVLCPQKYIYINMYDDAVFC